MSDQLVRRVFIEQSMVPQFVHLWILETKCECRQRSTQFRLHEGCDGARIDARAQPDADGYVAPQMQSHRVRQCGTQLI
jgi:hypothetical protein